MDIDLSRRDISSLVKVGVGWRCLNNEYEIDKIGVQYYLVNNFNLHLIKKKH